MMKNYFYRPVFVYVFSIIILFSLFLTVFFLRFDFYFYADIIQWVNVASYFNNILSPLLIAITSILIFITWHDNKKELSLLRRVNEEQRDAEMSRSLLVSILPIIEESIKRVKESKNKAYICLSSKKIESMTLSFKSLKDKSVINSVKISIREMSERILFKKNTFENNNVLYHPLSKECRVKLYSRIHSLLNKQLYRKYRKLPSENSERNIVLKYALEFLLNDDYLECIISEYLCSCEFSFCEYSDARFGRLENEIRGVDCLIQLQAMDVFFQEVREILYLAELVMMLSDRSTEKRVISKVIYKNLGRYEIYSFLEILYDYAYPDSVKAFTSYHMNCFEEIAKVLILNETIELYGGRISNKINNGIVERIEAIRDSISL